MKLVKFARMGKICFGALKAGGVVDLTGRIDHNANSVKDILKLNLVEKAKEYIKDKDGEISISEITFLPVIPDPEKIFCIGLNYQEHKKETGRPDVKNPTIFTRFANTQTGHLQPLVKPNFSDRFDYEGELAITIGKGGRYIKEKNALEHIAGYSCYNDGSVRDWQKHTSQFTPGKNFQHTGGFGPYMLTADEITDYKTLKIQTRLNGKVMQDATLNDLIFTIPEIIEYCSTFTELNPGDVIATGTPGGVGDRREPPVYMKDGDTVEIEISKLGVLKNPIIKER